MCSTQVKRQMSNREKIRVKKQNNLPVLLDFIEKYQGPGDIELSTNEKKRPYRALSLDGGGARGLFTLKLLSIIADEITKSQTTARSFATEFDLLVGLSIGGIIAAAIATGLFDDPKIREQLIRDGNEVFGRKNERPGLLEPVYTGKEKRDLLRLNFGELKLRDCKCKLMLLVVTSNFHPYIIESWNPEMQDWLIADCLNATSAAPYYFPPAPIGDRYFWDGGMYSNCPTDEAVLRLKELFNPNKEIVDFQFQVLSIGTSLPPQDPKPKDEPKITHPNSCGLIRLVQLGIIKAIGGLYNTTSSRLMKYEYGPEVILRMTAEVDAKFDDVSTDYQSKLKMEAIKIFNKHRIELELFFAKRV